MLGDPYWLLLLVYSSREGLQLWKFEDTCRIGLVEVEDVGLSCVIEIFMFTWREFPPRFARQGIFP